MNNEFLKIISSFLNSKELGETESFKKLPIKNVDTIINNLVEDTCTKIINTSRRNYLIINDFLENINTEDRENIQYNNLKKIKLNASLSHTSLNINHVIESFSMAYDQWNFLTGNKDLFVAEKDSILNSLTPDLIRFVEMLEIQSYDWFENFNRTLENLQSTKIKDLSNEKYLLNKKNFDIYLDYIIEYEDKMKNFINYTDGTTPILLKLENFSKIIKNLEKKCDTSVRFNNAQTEIAAYRKDNPLSKFIIEKNIEDKILYKEILTKAQDIHQVIILKDKSILLLTKDGYTTPKSRDGDYQAKSRIIAENVISYVLRKKPTFINIFKEKMISENYNLIGCIQAINSLLENEHLLRNKNFNVKTQLSENPLELFDDHINAIKLENQILVFAHSITSQKYKHLYNEETYTIFKQLFDLKLPKDLLQDNIGKKVASFKTPEEFNYSLNAFLSTLNEFSMFSMKMKMEGSNSSIAVEQETLLVLKINDFNTSKKLGSTSWCISRQEHYFNSYTESGNQQYFIYDFSKESVDDYSMIGITLNSSGNITAAHTKSDRSIDFDKKAILEFRNKIISNNIKSFKNLDESILEIINKNKDNQLKKVEI